MDLEPIEERANEFATWVGKFDSEHRIPAAFASAADVPALIDEVKRLRAELDQAAPHITYSSAPSPPRRSPQMPDSPTPITPDERAAMRERYAADLPSAWDTSAAAYGRVLRDLGTSARNDVPRLLDALDTAEAAPSAATARHERAVAYAGTDMAVITQTADTLLARFNITPKEDR